jgi:S1-C subfamily serine protease
VIKISNPGLRLLVAIATLASSPTIAQEVNASSTWRETLGRVSTGVVSIRVDGPRAFDTSWNQSTQATGFVVDAKQGLILTNRHVVTPGPVVAEAVFINNEEVELKAVYRDPVHDFGFYRYDPESLEFIVPAELPLDPAGAQIGREIRVVGNDAGEQISILAGTLARLDRRAPDYGRGSYNDFNTFYFQAASSTSGGSSGSPVIDIDGRVVALNAGANTQAASSFFLPLDRVQRALDLVRAGKEVERGTLMTEFTYAPYDELRRLGLTHKTESDVREQFPTATGMLVVEKVVPGSPVEGKLEPGDILVRVDGELVTFFIPLEDILDRNVGAPISLEIQRGGDTRRFEVIPKDLHSVSPATFLEFGDAVVNQLSYQQARHLNVAPEGIYVANPGYIFARAAIPRSAVITEINGVQTPTLAEFRNVIESLDDRESATVRFYTFNEPQGTQLRTIRMDRRWFPAGECHRDDRAGVWPCEPFRQVGQAPPPKAASTRYIEREDPRLARLAPSLVMVNFDMPYPVSGVAERYYHGTGVVLDTEKGLVVVDRNTVPVSMGDVRITIAGSLEVPGRVVWIHPLHNLAVVAYDPALIGDTPIRPASLSVDPVRPGDRLWVVGLKGDHRLISQSTEVASIDAVTFPLSRTLRFRETNMETVSLVNAPSDLDGVLVNEEGTVVSLWSSFAYHSGQDLKQVNKGVPAEIVAEVLDQVREGRELRSLEIELGRIPLSSGRSLGLSDDWTARLEEHDPERRQVLKVLRLVAGTPAAGKVKAGDLLLSIDGQVVNTYRQVEKLSQTPNLDLIVWRDGAEVRLNLSTVALDGRGVDRILVWAGALIQAPHRAMAAQRGIEPGGVYVAYFGYGSPATRYGLWAGRRIIEVDSKPTPDLDAFIAAVAGRSDRDAVRLKTVTWNSGVEVITLKLDNRYWPAYELRRNGKGWQRHPIDSPI